MAASSDQLAGQTAQLTEAVQSLDEAVQEVREARSPRKLTAAAGLLAGATAMYLLDPDNGRRRRHASRERALGLARH
jgi:hypothetical protein